MQFFKYFSRKAECVNDSALCWANVSMAHSALRVAAWKLHGAGAWRGWGDGEHKTRGDKSVKYRHTAARGGTSTLPTPAARNKDNIFSTENIQDHYMLQRTVVARRLVVVTLVLYNSGNDCIMSCSVAAYSCSTKFSQRNSMVKPGKINIGALLKLF